ncbi:hypothetical protein BDW22DRAFT_1355073 [Trametopsis cervina]|nr:hypothetical protein BDW22DRAFT_1359691 [Trametopsis cervina]KAI0344888.1 hypothetical protein BDW22DRAFT_1355073 [Trametopsis cervina]
MLDGDTFPCAEPHTLAPKIGGQLFLISAPDLMPPTLSIPLCQPHTAIDQPPLDRRMQDMLLHSTYLILRRM